jgi:Fuc2NAc and GlcNAc transferase
VAAVFILGGWTPGWAQFGSFVWLLLQTATIIAVVGSVNLFNFMDGIDGLAGSEAAYLGLGGAFVMSLTLNDPSIVRAALIVGASSIGFLAWNWPPAKIFMGDVGSGYLGLVFAILALDSARQEPALVFVWIILSATFLVDSVTTLVRRLVRGEQVHEAHRSHAYQWLARRFGRHQPVTLIYLAINVFWLFPMAWFCVRNPAYGPWIGLLALAPVVAGALAAGAGRKEMPAKD